MKDNELEKILRQTQEEANNQLKSGNDLGINGRIKRNASKKKYDYDEYLDETSYSKTKKKTRTNGKFNYK